MFHLKISRERREQKLFFGICGRYTILIDLIMVPFWDLVSTFINLEPSLFHTTAKKVNKHCTSYEKLPRPKSDSCTFILVLAHVHTLLYLYIYIIYKKVAHKDK